MIYDECTQKPRCSITHPLLVMGHSWDCLKKKNPTSLTRCWWWVHMIKKTACHSHPVYQAMGWDSLEKNTWSLTLYEMSGMKVSSKGKAQCHSLSIGHGMKCDDTFWKRNSLTSCWPWNEMWWDHLKGEKFTVTYILLFVWRDIKLTSLTAPLASVTLLTIC